MIDINERRASTVRLSLGEIAVVLVGRISVNLAAFWAAPGVLIVGGFLRDGMLHAFSRHGSLFVEDDLADDESNARHLYRMHEGEGRLAPQDLGGWRCLVARACLGSGFESHYEFTERYGYEERFEFDKLAPVPKPSAVGL